MDLVTILLIILIVLAFGGGNFLGNGAYSNQGNILGLIFIVVLILLVVRGHL